MRRNKPVNAAQYRDQAIDELWVDLAEYGDPREVVSPLTVEYVEWVERAQVRRDGF